MHILPYHELEVKFYKTTSNSPQNNLDQLTACPRRNI